MAVTKKKKIGSVKKPASKKIGAVKKVTVKIKKASPAQIVKNEIATCERIYKKLKTKTAKSQMASIINILHDKLDGITAK